ncbi:MAG: YeeE/YedE family protein [Flavobacteriaceae bacterium]
MSSTSAVSPSRAEAVPAGSLALPPVDRSALGFALAALALFTAIIGLEVSGRMALLFLIGAGLGAALLHGAFGFTAGWRQAWNGDGRGLRAQFVVIALTSLFFIPLINGYAPEGLQLRGALAPVGTSLVVGAFIFGLGMQLGNGCGSGTLFTLGGGSKRMAITLAGFIAGAVVGAIHLPWWLAQPGFDPVNLVDSLGVPGTILAQAAALGLIAWFTLRREKALGIAPAAAPRAPLSQRLLRGPWTPLEAGLALVALGVATLLVAGHPWTITFGFTVWGAKIASVFGVDMSQFEFFTWDRPARALSQSVLADNTSVMNTGLILGAMLAAALAGKFATDQKIPLRSAAGALIGGLLMGYGARLAFGCNIGAYLAGIASGSLHGWVWFAAAFAGTVVGIRVRPFFGLSKS